MRPLFQITTFLSILLFSNLLSANNQIDSLQNVLLNATSVEDRINTQIKIATVYRKFSVDSAKKYGYTALQNSQVIKDTILQIKSYFALAAGYQSQAPYDLYLSYTDSAEYLSEQISYQQGIAKAYYFKGAAHFSKSNYEESASYLVKALDKYTQLGDKEYMARLMHFIGHFYVNTGDYTKALTYTLDSKTIFEELNLHEDLIYSLNNLAIIYKRQHDTINSIKTWKECYGLTKQYGQIDDQLRGLNNLANIYFFSNQMDSAKYYYVKAIHFGDSLNQQINLLYPYYNLAYIYFEQGDFNKAEKYFQTTLENSCKVQENNITINSLYRLAEIYKQFGDYEKSLSYFQSYREYKDSLETTNSSYILDKAISDQKLEETLTELQLLKDQQTAMVKKNRLMILMAVFSLIGFYAYWYYQRRLFFNVVKSAGQNNQDDSIKSLWHYKFPRKEAKNWHLIGVSMLFVGLVYGFTFFLFPGNSIFYLQTGAAVLSGILFYLSYKGVALFQERLNDMPQKRELLQSLLANLAFVLSASLIILVLNHYGFTLINFGLTALATISSCFLALLTLGILSFRSNYDLLFGSLFEKLNKQLAQNISTRKQLESNLKEENHGSILVEDKNIQLNNILYIVSDNVYQEFRYFEKGKINKMLTRKTLSTIEKELACYPNFIRCHRSYIVNSEKILEVRGNSRQQFLITEITNERIPLSRTQATHVLAYLETVNSN